MDSSTTTDVQEVNPRDQQAGRSSVMVTTSTCRAKKASGINKSPFATHKPDGEVTMEHGSVMAIGPVSSRKESNEGHLDKQDWMMRPQSVEKNQMLDSFGVLSNDAMRANNDALSQTTESRIPGSIKIKENGRGGHFELSQVDTPNGMSRALARSSTLQYNDTIVLQSRDSKSRALINTPSSANGIGPFSNWVSPTPATFMAAKRNSPDTPPLTPIQSDTEQTGPQRPLQSGRPTKMIRLTWGAPDLEKQATAARQAWLDRKEQLRVNQEQCDRVQKETDAAESKANVKKQELEQVKALRQASSMKANLASAKFRAKAKAMTKKREDELEEELKKLREQGFQKIKEKEVFWLQELGPEEEL